MLGFGLTILVLVLLLSRMWKENDFAYRQKAREKENARLEKIFQEMAEKNRRIEEKAIQKQNKRMWDEAEKELKKAEKRIKSLSILEK